MEIISKIFRWEIWEKNCKKKKKIRERCVFFRVGWNWNFMSHYLAKVWRVADIWLELFCLPNLFHYFCFSLRSLLDNFVLTLLKINLNFSFIEVSSKSLMSWFFCYLIFGIVGRGVLTAKPCPSRCACEKDFVDCSGLGLTKVPSDVPKTTQSLWVCKITFAPRI